MGKTKGNMGLKRKMFSEELSKIFILENVTHSKMAVATGEQGEMEYGDLDHMTNKCGRRMDLLIN